MSAITFNKFFLLNFFLVFVLLFSSTAFAMVATPSDAMDFVTVPVASSSNALPLDEWSVSTPSNALPSQDYMETDDFDTLDVPSLLSDGEGNPFTGGTVLNYSSVYAKVEYYDMLNTVRSVTAYCNADGYFSVPKPNDFVKPYTVNVYIPTLPPSGKYKFAFYFGSNTGGFTYSTPSVFVNRDIKNSVTAGNWNTPSFTQSSGDYSMSINLDTTGASHVRVRLVTSNLILPYGGYVSCRFEPTTSSASVGVNTPTNNGVTSSMDADISDGIAQQVEQGDTIIELIKNTIQTISSQLTAFWNQLAGEFTNLYGKMDVQHQESMGKVDEQIDNDNSNTDKVTTAIETHGNFIIEGLKKLFIPSDEYFKAYFDDLYSWFSERFGFLSFPIDLLLEVIGIFVNSSQTDCVLVLPSFTIMENLLWPEMSFNLTEFLNTNFSFVVVAIKTITSIYLVMAFVQLCEEKWNEVMMN